MQQQLLGSLAIAPDNHGNVRDLDGGWGEIARSRNETLDRLAEFKRLLMEVEDSTQKENHRLQSLESWIELARPQAKSTSAVASSLQPTADVAVSSKDSGNPASESSAQSYVFNRDIPPPENAVQHYDDDRQPDYWSMWQPSGSNLKIPVRVVPIGSSPLGIFVHSLDDGHNYVLTSSGAWLSGS